MKTIIVLVLLAFNFWHLKVAQLFNLAEVTLQAVYGCNHGEDSCYRKFIEGAKVLLFIIGAEILHRC